MIEKCLQLYMNQTEVITALHRQAKIEPGFTSLGMSLTSFHELKVAKRSMAEVRATKSRILQSVQYETTNQRTNHSF